MLAAEGDSEGGETRDAEKDPTTDRDGLRGLGRRHEARRSVLARKREVKSVVVYSHSLSVFLRERRDSILPGTTTLSTRRQKEVVTR